MAKVNLTKDEKKAVCSIIKLRKKRKGLDIYSSSLRSVEKKFKC